MPTYKYKVRDKSGKLTSGTISGENRDAVAIHFESMDYTPISIEEAAQAQQISFFSGFGRVKAEDMNLFNRQLVTLIKAGLTLASALSAIKKQTKSIVLKKAVDTIINDIEGGKSFSDSLSRHPSIFNELYINTVKAGEAGGTLDVILERLADLAEHETETNIKIKSATRYPIIAMVVLSIAFFVLSTFVVPQFVKLFDRFKGELPIPTKILIWMNVTITNYWYIAVIFVAVLIFVYKRFARTKFGRKFVDNIRLKIPVFGPLVFMLTMSRFARILSLMIKSGVPILGALELVAKTTGNSVVEGGIRDIIKSVNQGKSMSEPMASSKVFSPIVIQMVAIGEETGKIDDLLFHISEYYDQQSDYIIKNLATLIEPILIVIMGCAVLLLALAIFLPMWNMIGLFRS